MKRIWYLILLSALFLAGCDRAATRTNWSPILPTEATAAETELPATLAATSTPVAAATATATANPTTQPLGALDVSSLPSKLPTSAKGYELYSWQTGDEWNFTLITGTNRTKSFEEIIAPENSVNGDGLVKISVKGVDDLETVLKRMPKGEDILWAGWEIVDEIQPGMVYLTFPPQTIMDQVAAICTAQHLNLTSLKTN